MNIIAAIDLNYGIGKDGDLLFHIPEDLKRFKELTLNNVVIMGRKTYESLPVKPLKNRVNIVVTTDANYKPEGVYTAHDIIDAIEKAKKFHDKEIFCIGGASIYNQMIKYCDTLYLTLIEESKEADTFFPKFMSKEWKRVKVSDKGLYKNMAYRFYTYKRVPLNY